MLLCCMWYISGIEFERKSSSWTDTLMPIANTLNETIRAETMKIIFELFFEGGKQANVGSFSCRILECVYAL